MKRRGPLTVKGHFIDDLDPYDGLKTMPLPLAEESDSDAVWQEFQDSVVFQDSLFPDSDNGKKSV